SWLRSTLPPTPSPKRRGGAEGDRRRACSSSPLRGVAAVFLPLSASGRGPRRGVLQTIPRGEMMRNRCRPAFTLLESLVCLSLLLILLGLLVPAVARARAAARGQVSTNNLRMIALSVHNYADAKNGVLPPGFDDNHFSAASRLLPYLE